MAKYIFERTKYLNIIILLSIFFHLISINFYPTNFEGGYGEYADFFNSKDKLNYVKYYYSTQFNSYLFSLFGSIINFLIPFLDSFQSIKILSYSSYFFLGYGIYNLLKFYNYKDKTLIFLIVIFFNSIIWNYGYRSFNDLFVFSLAIFFFSRILLFHNTKYIYLDSIFIGISVALKSYNLIFLFPILIFFYSLNSLKTKKIKYFFCFLLILFPLFLLNFLTYKYLGFAFSPPNEDLKIAIIGGDNSRNFLWVINNYIFYIGYITLISFPFVFIFFLNYCKKNFSYISIVLIFFAFISFFIQDFFFISSELDFGPLQKYIPEYLYKSIIIFNFLFFFLVFYFFLKNKRLKKRKFINGLITLIIVLLYLFVLSFIKASQRYLILPIPFLYIVFFYVVQPRILIYLTLMLYFFINTLLLINYYITGKSTEDILSFLKKKDILEATIPGVMTPNVYHMYSINNSIKNLDKNKINIETSQYIIANFEENSVFNSKVNFFGYEFKKYSVIRIKK